MNPYCALLVPRKDHGVKRKSVDKTSSASHKAMQGLPVPPSPSVSLAVCCEYDEVPYDTKKELTIMVTLKAASFPDEMRASVDLVAVVDKSGSMKADIHLVKETLKFITSQLNHKDRLAIISFNEKIAIELPLTNMSESGQERAREAIDGMTARGNTNLSEAVLTGLRILRDRPEGQKNIVGSLLVFTDGRTNTGLLSTRRIVAAMLNPDDPEGHNSTHHRPSSGEGRTPLRESGKDRDREREKEKEREKEREREKRHERENYKREVGYSSPRRDRDKEREREREREKHTEDRHREKEREREKEKERDKEREKERTPLRESKESKERKCSTPRESRRHGTSTSNLELPCTVYTFGYGTSHNANMLKAICDVGHGVYYYIENEAAISDSFADCLGGLLSVAAQDIALTFQAENGTEIRKVMQYRSTAVTEGETYRLKTGDIQSEEQRDVLVQVFLPALKKEEERVCLSMKLEYQNVLIAENETIRSSVYIKRVKSVPPDVEPNKAVQLCKLRIQTADAFERANRLAKEKEIDNARDVLLDLIKHLSESKLAKNFFVVGLRNDIEECLAGLKDTDSYIKGGQQRLNSINSEYQTQRNSRAGTKSMFSTRKKNNMLTLSRNVTNIFRTNYTNMPTSPHNNNNNK